MLLRAFLLLFFGFFIRPQFFQCLFAMWQRDNCFIKFFMLGERAPKITPWTF
jgi:hypothetical protein